MATSNRQDMGDLEQSAVLVEIIHMQLKDGVPKKQYSADSLYNIRLIQLHASVYEKVFTEAAAGAIMFSSRTESWQKLAALLSSIT